jgi:hypothetical protein
MMVRFGLAAKWFLALQSFDSRVGKCHSRRTNFDVFRVERVALALI